jgi:hypothetical protein
MTSNTNAMFARLNDLRVRADMKPLKHPLTVAKMQAAIDKLAPTNASVVAEYARSKGVDPKVARNLLRRHLAKPATGWALTNDVKALIDASAERVAA